MGKVFLVGAGPGDPDLPTVTALGQVEAPAVFIIGDVVRLGGHLAHARCAVVCAG